jgi:hypothetical protein
MRSAHLLLALLALPSHLIHSLCRLGSPRLRRDHPRSGWVCLQRHELDALHSGSTYIANSATFGTI